MPPARRTPADRKQAGDDDAMFVWTAASGDTIRIPKVSTIGSGVLRKYRKLDEADFMFSVLEEVMSAKELTALDRVPLGEINQLFSAWMAESGADAPQS